MEFMTGTLGAPFALYAGAVGVLTVLALARRTAGAPDQARPEAYLAPLGLAALAVAFATASATDVRLGAGALLLTGLVFLAAAPVRGEWAPPGRRLGQILIVLAIAVALAGAFLSVTDAPNSAS